MKTEKFVKLYPRRTVRKYNIHRQWQAKDGTLRLVTAEFLRMVKNGEAWEVLHHQTPYSSLVVIKRGTFDACTDVAQESWGRQVGWERSPTGLVRIREVG